MSDTLKEIEKTKNKNETLKNLLDVPADLILREKIEELADRLISLNIKSRKKSPALPELQRLANTLLKDNDLPLLYTGYAVICLFNAYWETRMAGIAFDRRILMLPRCLRPLDICPLDPTSEFFDTKTCQECMKCDVGGIVSHAVKLGYRLMVATGTPIVLKLLAENDADAVIGVACTEVLSKALQRVRASGVPAMAVPLLCAGCEDTSVDVNKLYALMSMKRNTKVEFTEGYRPLLNETRRLFENELENMTKRFLPEIKPGSSESIILDWLKTGGKRFRPFITISAYDAIVNDGVRDTDYVFPAGVKNAAMAIEIFHKASLAHDDIEDDDAFRYGKATLHEKHGIPMAVNLGDYLIGLGYRAAGLSGNGLSDNGIAPDIVSRIASAHTRLAEGQGKELQWRNNRCILPSLEVLEIYALKTTPAFEAALYAGVRCALPVSATLNEDLILFSRHLGVGFQILDDLHEWDEKTAIGNEIGGDLHKAPIILSSLAKEGFGSDKQERLEALIAGDKMDWKIQKRVHKYFRESDAYEKAIALARRCRKRSLDVANRIEPIELGDLLRFFVEKILPLPKTEFQKDSATIVSR